ASKWHGSQPTQICQSEFKIASRLGNRMTRADRARLTVSSDLMRGSRRSSASGLMGDEGRTYSPDLPRMSAWCSRFVASSCVVEGARKPASMLDFSEPKECGRPWGEGRPRANPVWGRGGVGT